MQFLKRFYQLITLLVILVVAILVLNKGVSFEDKPPSGEAAVLLKKVDGLIAKLQRNNQPGEATETPQGISYTGEAVTAETGTHSAQQPVQVENTLHNLPEKMNVSAQVDEETTAARGSHSRSAEPSVSAGNTAGEAASPPAPSNSAVKDGLATAKTGAGARTEQSEVTPERIRQTWQQARLAAWQGEFATAIEHYRTLVAQQPDNFDAYGEMGNVLLNSGDREGAAEAYYRAATLINNTPHRMMAWHLLNVLAWLAPEKADKLYQELLPRP